MAELRLPSSTLTRRGFLVGAAATAMLAACSSGSDTSDDGNAENPSDPSAVSSDTSDSASLAVGTYVVAQRFPPNMQEPGPVRLPISLADDDGQFLSDGPAVLGAQITDIDGAPVGERLSANRRDVDPAAYYSFRADVDEPGVYYLVVDGGPAEGAAFQIMEPGSVTVPGAGQPLPPFDTPTADDARGIDPICTRDPGCPFHDVTLTDALASGKQVVYLVGTPAFCQTGSCAPALDSIIDVHERYSDTYTFVHAEVYTDNTATTTAPAVEAAGLTYEPVLFITDADGIVVDRLDAVWDESELVEALDQYAA